MSEIIRVDVDSLSHNLACIPKEAKPKKAKNELARHLEKVSNVRSKRYLSIAPYGKSVTYIKALKPLLIPLSFWRYKIAFRRLTRLPYHLNSSAFSVNVNYEGYVKSTFVSVDSCLFGKGATISTLRAIPSDHPVVYNPTHWENMPRLLKSMAILSEQYQQQANINTIKPQSPMGFFTAQLHTKATPDSLLINKLNNFRKKCLINQLITTAEACTRREDFSVKCLLQTSKGKEHKTLTLSIKPMGYCQQLRGKTIKLFNARPFHSLSITELKAAISFIHAAYKVTLTNRPAYTSGIPEELL